MAPKALVADPLAAVREAFRHETTKSRIIRPIKCLHMHTSLSFSAEHEEAHGPALFVVAARLSKLEEFFRFRQRSCAAVR